MSRHLRATRDVKRRPHGQREMFAALPPRQEKKRSLPRLCLPQAHDFRFCDRVQLGLPDAACGGYEVAHYLACTRCVGVVEFLGVYEVATAQTAVHSAWLLYPDGRGYELPLLAARVLLTAHG